MLLTTVAGVVVAMQVGKVPPALPSVRAHLALGMASAGWIASIFNANAALLGLAAGMLADRLGHRRSVTTGLLVVALGSAGGALAPSGTVLLLARFVEGLGFVAVVTAGPGLIVRVMAERKLRLALALWATYMPTGIALMMAAAPLVLAAGGWRALWLLNAALVFACALLFLVGTHGLQLPIGARRNWRDMVPALVRPGPWLLAGCFACYTFQFFALMSWLPTFLVEDLGASLTLAAGLTAAIVATNIIGNLLGGWLLHRGVARWRLLAGVVGTLSLLGMGVLAAPFPAAIKLTLAFCFAGIGGMLPTACLAAAPVHAPSPGLVGTVNGIIVQGANTGTLLGAPALGAAVAALGGWTQAGPLLLVAGSCGVLLALAVRRVENRLHPRRVC